MALHTLKLDDLELTALITHLEGQNEIMCESRLNSSNPSETPDREEVLLNLILSNEPPKKVVRSVIACSCLSLLSARLLCLSCVPS